MTRSAPFALAALAATFIGASPAAAQSLGMIHLPGQAVVQDTLHPRLTYAPPSAPQPLLYAAEPTDLPVWRPEQSVRAPAAQPHTQRFVESDRARPNYGAVEYGPFRVVDGQTVMLLGETDSRSPAQFARLLRDHPGLARLEMVECPGTLDDRANLELGRMIRRAETRGDSPRGIRRGKITGFQGFGGGRGGG